MTATADITEIAKWDPVLTERVMGIIRPMLKRYFRSEVHGLDNVPNGGARVDDAHRDRTFARGEPF